MQLVEPKDKRPMVPRFPTDFRKLVTSPYSAEHTVDYIARAMVEDEPPFDIKFEGYDEYRYD